MPSKQSGFDFWSNVLGSPKYVAAPMVDMSELAYRMLCRRYGAQLCYSPMFHSQQFAQDFLYRKDNFSTCAVDRPLIVQFCANDPSNFTNAASMVQSQCDAVDLNLGCPQAIARKGYYGSFLQDDWDVIRSIVQNAAYELDIPVTCKMRILPGHYNKSLEYAKMLEHAGCSVLAVHGRTREQKGHATGLASWDVIKEIKANVNIPVIANGNILSFDDVENCLQYTGADAVMSAEALLHNPALFSAKNPPVWKIVEEYLQLAESYNTSIRFVRCHLFKILYLCIYQDSNVQQILTDGSSFSDFYKVIDLLKDLPKKQSSQNNSNKIKEPLDSDNTFDLLNCNVQERTNVDNLEQNNSNLNSIVSDICQNTQNVELISDFATEVNNCDLRNMEYDLETISTITDEAEGDKDFQHLPVWICHSRPRVAVNDKSRGCFSKYFDVASEKSTDLQFMSKKQLRRARHHNRVVAGMREKRKVKKLRRKQKMAESQTQQTEPVPGTCYIKDDSEKKKNLTKKEQKALIRERLLKAQGIAPKICINLGFTSLMGTKELSRLSSQLRRLYGSNRHSETPLHLYFCSFNTSGELYKICLTKNDGFSSYVVEMTPEAPEDLFSLEDIVYLTPDSQNVLQTLTSKKIYVIGGIVDGTPKKDLCLNHAEAFNVQTARLPIPEYLVPFSTNPGTTVLTVNQVFDILLKYYETNDWTESLSSNIPVRKGFCAPSQKDDLKDRTATAPIDTADSYGAQTSSEITT